MVEAHQMYLGGGFLPGKSNPQPEVGDFSSKSPAIQKNQLVFDINFSAPADVKAKPTSKVKPISESKVSPTETFPTDENVLREIRYLKMIPRGGKVFLPMGARLKELTLAEIGILKKGKYGNRSAYFTRVPMDYVCGEDTRALRAGTRINLISRPTEISGDQISTVAQKIIEYARLTKTAPQAREVSPR